MRQGYLVRAADGTTAPGTGAVAAGAWLDGLATAARGACVVALPFADADLGALARGNLGDLGRRAVTDGRTVLAETVGTPVLDGTTWPADGVLDEPALGDVAAAGTRAVVLRGDAVDGDPPDSTSGVVPLAGAGSSPLLAVLSDPLLSRAAAVADGTVVGAGPVDPASRTLPAGVAGPVNSTDAGTSAALSTQAALAALVYRAQAPPPAGGPIVLAPPHLWTADATAAGALLDALDLLLGAGSLTSASPRGVRLPAPSSRSRASSRAPAAVASAVHRCGGARTIGPFAGGGACAR